MKRLLAVFVIVGLSAPLSAQDFPNPQPGDPHKIFALDVGTWDADVRMYLQGPDQLPTRYKGEETNELVCNGLFSRSTFKSQMGDRAYEGHSLNGYDANARQYVSMYVDSFNANPTVIKGTYDADSKTLTSLATIVNAGQEVKQKMVTRYVDDRTKEFEIRLIFDVGGQEQEIKMMDMTLTKRQ